MNDLTKQFVDFVTRIGEYLEREIPKIKFKVFFQDKESNIEIEPIGKRFGVLYDKKGNLILAKWLLESSAKEQNTIAEFLLIREAFRHYYNQEITDEDPYVRLTDVVVQVSALMWFCEQRDITLTSSATIALRRRTDAYDEDVKPLESEYWVFFYTKLNQQKIHVGEVFNTFIVKYKAAIEEEQTLYDFTVDMLRWMKTKVPDETINQLPFLIEKKRHFNVLKALSQERFEDGSALNISEKLNRSHNVVNRDYQQIMEKYYIYWMANINLLNLRLYPYFFRVDLKNKESMELLMKKFLANRYIRYIKHCGEETKPSLVGWIESSLTIYEEVAEYLEGLKKKELIEDYFIKQIRRRRITWSITTERLEPIEETYLEILSDNCKLPRHTITFVDDTYDITEAKKRKKEHFNEDVLTFLSTLMLHHLGKTYYRFKPIEIVYELLEKNNVDLTNTADVLYYVNQIDLRCRRLGLVDYGLYFREIHTLKFGMYFEFKTNSGNEKLQEVLTKLERLGEMLRIDLIDRTLLIFPYTRTDSLVRKVIEKMLEENNLDYKLTQIQHSQETVLGNKNYVDAFDFKSQQWKID